MAEEKVFRAAVKVGNWTEDLLLEEAAKKEFLEKEERGEHSFQKKDLIRENLLRPVNLSMTNDGQLHFGDVVMLVNVGGENRECSAVSVNADIDSLIKIPSPGIKSPCGVSAGRGILPCARTAFIITSVDGSPEGSTLLYDQSFALTTTNGFARGLYLTSDRQSFQKADVKVLIVHCKTNQALAVLGNHILWTIFHKEYEVTAHTFLDSHKAEEDKNHWILCTSKPAGASPVSLNHPESAGDNEELTQGNTDGI
ncbi:cilia- and flagella-associated protein 161 isoform X2 [Paralichthys olivaceus]|uniref:cilia- and flagella-associated protein 161 isoform X2 n=1 Tax=Paralichthys olivaceus TaxID=8255 RepID=UPI00097D88A8|nr:PREDICTED: cilia- and flagella-associated protein 161 isoform X2 [Paralichthys olivaceus]